MIAVTGDGGFGQYLAEFTTAVKYGMPITHVLLNNAELGKISREQVSAIRPVWQTDLVNPDFAAYAESCGGRGFRVDTRDGSGQRCERRWRSPTARRWSRCAARRRRCRALGAALSGSAPSDPAAVGQLQRRLPDQLRDVDHDLEAIPVRRRRTSPVSGQITSFSRR